VIDGVAPLDFAARREADSASWTRADPDAALIERIAWNTWLVVLPDGEHVHEVTLEKRHGAYVGDCEIRDGDRCPARKYNDRDEPCAHLCTIYQGTLFNDPTDDGDRIEVFDRDDVEIASADPHIEDAMADGGREVGR
jgi:hypothetical protein